LGFLATQSNKMGIAEGKELWLCDSTLSFGIHLGFSGFRCQCHLGCGGSWQSVDLKGFWPPVPAPKIHDSEWFIPKMRIQNSGIQQEGWLPKPRKSGGETRYHCDPSWSIHIVHIVVCFVQHTFFDRGHSWAVLINPIITVEIAMACRGFLSHGSTPNHPVMDHF
jgi:hypothetical protein